MGRLPSTSPCENDTNEPLRKSDMERSNSARFVKVWHAKSAPNCASGPILFPHNDNVDSLGPPAFDRLSSKSPNEGIKKDVKSTSSSRSSDKCSRPPPEWAARRHCITLNSSVHPSIATVLSIGQPVNARCNGPI
eukprot:scaffold48836_cov32-Tisochrysis_lutea.AAC.3